MSGYHLWERPLSHSATLGDLVASDFLSPDAAKVIVDQVKAGRDVVVYGPPKSGRTSLAAALCTMVPLKTAVGIPEDTSLTLDRQGLHSVGESDAVDLRVLRDVTSSEDLTELSDPDVSVTLVVTAASLAEARKVLADMGAAQDVLEQVGVWVGLSVESVKRLGKRRDRRFVSNVTLSTPNGDKVISEGFVDPSGRPRHDGAKVVIHSAPLLPEPSMGEIVLGVGREGEAIAVPVESNLQVAGGSSKERVEVTQGVVRQLLAQGWSVLLYDRDGRVARKLDGLVRAYAGTVPVTSQRRSLTGVVPDTKSLVNLLAPHAKIVERTLLARFVDGNASLFLHPAPTPTAPSGQSLSVGQGFAVGQSLSNGTTQSLGVSQGQSASSSQGLSLSSGQSMSLGTPEGNSATSSNGFFTPPVSFGAPFSTDPMVEGPLRLDLVASALFAAKVSSLVRDESEVKFLRECGAVLSEMLTSDLCKGEGLLDPSGAGLTVLGGLDVTSSFSYQFLESLKASWSPGGAPGRAIVVAGADDLARRFKGIIFPEPISDLHESGVTLVLEGVVDADLQEQVKVHGSTSRAAAETAAPLLGMVPEEVREVRVRSGEVVSDVRVGFEEVPRIKPEELVTLGAGEFLVSDLDGVRWCDTTRSLALARPSEWGKSSQKRKVVLGSDKTGRPFFLGEDELRMHALMFGSTGSGKSEALKTLAGGLFDLGWDGIIIDGRGDYLGAGSLHEWCQQFGMATSRPYQALFAQSDTSPTWHNPLRGLGPDEMRDLLVSLTSFDSASYWEALSKKLLGQVINLHLDAYAVDPVAFPFPTLRDLGMLLSSPSLPTVSKKMAATVIAANPGRTQDDYNALLRPSKDEVTTASGLGAKLTVLYDTPASRSLLTRTEGKTMLDVTAPGLTYVGLDTIGAPMISRVISSSVLQQLNAHTRSERTEIRAPRFIIVDEASRMDFHALMTLLSRARSAGITVILSDQSPMDWATNEGIGRFHLLNQNTNVMIAMSQGERKSAEMLSEEVSTRKRGPGAVSADQLRSLGIGEAIIRVGKPNTRLTWVKMASRRPKPSDD